jgi:ribosomal protein S18 acetylase RimI-like enzyme
MHLLEPKITKINASDAETLNYIIEDEFPYTSFSIEDIKKKLKNKNFFLIKHHQRNILTGFAETEFFPGKEEARLNAIFVEEAWRGQRIATQLLKRVIHEAKRRKGIYKLFLLVKESNKGAKHLYEKLGFEFEKIHNKELDGSRVEVWSMGIV